MLGDLLSGGVEAGMSGVHIGLVATTLRHPERVEQAVLQGLTTPLDERSWFWQFVTIRAR
jgi:hypothetical protein